jgi:anti-sigma-K factor RskA
MTSEAITDDDLRDVIDTLTARVAELEGENKKWAAMKSEDRITERIRLLIAENARLREACDMAAFKLEYAASILEAHSATATVAMGMSELASQLRTALKEQP